MPRARAHVFTCNNPDPIEDYPSWDGEKMTYLIFQQEVGQSGVPHWQGYVHWLHARDAVVFSRRSWSNRFHWEIARGSAEQNKAYCSKTDCTVLIPPQEFGEIPSQGKRSDLQELLVSIQAGSSDTQLYQDFGTTFLRHMRMVEAARVMESRLRAPLMAPRTVLWLHGPTECGKTRLAHHLLSLMPSYWDSTEARWFNGYHGQQAVLFDDWSPQDVELQGMTTLLKQTDRYPVSMPCKLGVPVHWSATLIVFTSNWSITEMFAGSHRLSAFRRRVTLEFDLTSDLSQDALLYMLMCMFC